MLTLCWLCVIEAATVPSSFARCGAISNCGHCVRMIEQNGRQAFTDGRRYCFQTGGRDIACRLKVAGLTVACHDVRGVEVLAISGIDMIACQDRE